MQQANNSTPSKYTHNTAKTNDQKHTLHSHAFTAPEMKHRRNEIIHKRYYFPYKF